MIKVIIMKYDIQVLKNDDLPESVSDFLNYLETIRSKSPNTIDGYKIDVTLFFRFLCVYSGFVKNDI